jgi:hypothetical protein
VSGHGHVIPNPDEAKARCGGPALCRVCAIEAHRAIAEAKRRADDDVTAYVSYVDADAAAADRHRQIPEDGD